ncbi:hypothetical protein pb186bvf_001963 [Paramecium bursaria]
MKNSYPKAKSVNQKVKPIMPQKKLVQPHSTLNTTRYQQQSPYIIKKPQQEYQKVSHSLNGSFELQRRYLTILEQNLVDNRSPQMTLYKPQRAQSVVDDYKDMQTTLRPQPPPKMEQRIIPYDSETSFEGYRKGDPRYLTLESESNLLEDYNVKDFLQSKKFGHNIIKHFINTLDEKQMNYVDQCIKRKKGKQRKF